MSVFYLWIASQIPYTGDDWDWGLDIGLQHLLTADINSRYAGNLLVLVIMFSSKMYETLFSEGMALDGGRWLAFEPNSGIVGPLRRCTTVFLRNLAWQL